MASATAPAVVPRWEWRAFGREFRDLAERLRMGPGPVTTSHETYILSPDSAINVKIRGGQIDVKRLLAVDRGLELWSPVLKAPFPIAAAVARSLFLTWSVKPPPLARAEYTRDQWLAEVVAACPALAAIDVAKQRQSAVLDDCAVEIAALTIGGERLATVAVEAADPDQVLRVAQGLGLAALGNENYVHALRRLRAAHAAGRHRAREGATP